jgi:hypothetical protein
MVSFLISKDESDGEPFPQVISRPAVARTAILDAEVMKSHHGMHVVR